MNYGELKNNIRDLGFEDDIAIQENTDIVISSANRAINTINLTVMPILETYIIQKDAISSSLVRYNLKELAPGFLCLNGKPMLESGDNLVSFNDYEIENGKILVLKGAFIGKLNCHYKKSPTKITYNTADTYNIDLDEAAHELVPLLASYYIWLDDDNVKAIMYQNMYDDLKKEIMMSIRAANTLKITGGVSWEN